MENEEVAQDISEIESERARDTSSHSRHAQCCLFCVKVNDKRGMKSGEKGKTTARVQSPPSQLIQLHAGSLHNGPILILLLHLHSSACVCECV